MDTTKVTKLEDLQTTAGARAWPGRSLMASVNSIDTEPNVDYTL